MNLIILLLLYINLPNLYLSQKSDKIWIDGQGGAFFSSDAQTNEEDTISASNISSGYNLIDLNTHINPLETIENPLNIVFWQPDAIQKRHWHHYQQYLEDLGWIWSRF